MELIQGITNISKAFYTRLVMHCVSFIDRNYNLLFYKNDCMRLYFKPGAFKYNDIITTETGKVMRCLGKTWYCFT